MVLALFDLDNTLLAGDSDYEWAQFLIDKGVLDRERYESKNQVFYDRYKAGTLDIFEFLAFQLRPLAEHPRKQLDAWHREFMETRIRPMIRDSARALVDSHRGETRVIITATNSFVTAPIAQAFGVEHLIATEPAVRDGAYTGGVDGIPCFQGGKVTRLEAWLHDRGENLKNITKSTFYSDSHNDLPLLERVTHPVAVDPDERLRAHALAHQWPVLAL
jgi:HAD superfamily hydrolase (TIGR01490 family)